jgi:carboxymethylenebutenolidase
MNSAKLRNGMPLRERARAPAERLCAGEITRGTMVRVGMDRKRASDYPPEVLKLFDGYVHNTISRRDFLSRAAKYAVGGMTALAMLDSLQPNWAFAEQVSKTDERITTEYVTYPSAKGSGEMKGYLAKPAVKVDAKSKKPVKAKKLPGVVVVHENRGLNPYVEDVTRRLAVAGYIAFAPDALTPLGGYPGDEEKARELFQKLDAAKRTEDMIATAEYVKARPDVTAKIGAVGFCFGGGVCNMLASRLPWLAAAVPFYGSGVTADEAKAIKAPLQLHFAATDERINAAWPEYKAALDKYKVRYEAHHYPETQHGFHNDTTPRYDEKAATLAWTRTLGFFKKHLRA